MDFPGHREGMSKSKPDKTLPDKTLQVYGRRLRMARLRAGVTQAAVAKVAECQQPFISKVERGEATLRPFDYPRVAALLGVSVLDLIGALTKEEKAEIEEANASTRPDED